MHAFDIQSAAIEATQAAVAAAVPSGPVPAVHYHLASHAEMRERLGCTACASLVVFNLGEGGSRVQAGVPLALPACMVPSGSIPRAMLAPARL